MPSARRGGAVRQLRSLHRGLAAGFPPREDGRQGWPRPKAHGCACHRKARSQPTLQRERAARAWHSRRPSPHRLECAGAVRERARARVPMQSPRALSAQAPCAPSPTHAAAAKNGNDAFQHSAQTRPHQTIRTVRQEKARGVALPIDIFGQRRLDLPILRQIPMLHSFFLPSYPNVCSLNQYSIQNIRLASVLMQHSS